METPQMPAPRRLARDEASQATDAMLVVRAASRLFEDAVGFVNDNDCALTRENAAFWRKVVDTAHDFLFDLAVFPAPEAETEVRICYDLAFRAQQSANRAAENMPKEA
jgi:hypothetical protein